MSSEFKKSWDGFVKELRDAVKGCILFVVVAVLILFVKGCDRVVVAIKSWMAAQ